MTWARLVKTNKQTIMGEVWLVLTGCAAARYWHWLGDQGCLQIWFSHISFSRGNGPTPTLSSVFMVYIELNEADEQIYRINLPGLASTLFCIFRNNFEFCYVRALWTAVQCWQALDSAPTGGQRDHLSWNKDLHLQYLCCPHISLSPDHINI